MMGRFVMALLAFSLGLNMVLVVGWMADEHNWFEKKSDDDKKKSGKVFEIPADELGLEGEQVSQWEEIRRRQNLEMLRMRASSVQRLHCLRELMSRDELTSSALDSYIEDMREGTTDYAASMLDAYLQQRSILKPPQEEQLQEILKDRLDRMIHWNEHRFEHFRHELIQEYGEPFVDRGLSDLNIPPSEEASAQ